MIYSLPNAPFVATLENAPSAVATMGVQVLKPDGTVVQARSTSIVKETPAASGLYVAKFTAAPAEGGVYLIFWDNGTISPTTTSVDELTVTLTPPEAPTELPAVGVIAGMVAGVLEEGELDITEAQAVRALSDAHALMCTRSKCFRRTLSLGVTIEGQTEYTLPAEVAEIVEVQVGGVSYGAGRRSEISQNANHWLWISGPSSGGMAAADHDAAGAAKVALMPISPTSGQAIQIYAICRPAALVPGVDAGIRVPAEFLPAIVDRAIATFLRRTEGRHDQAQPFSEIFDAACVELERQTARRFKIGPREARIRGVNG